MSSSVRVRRRLAAIWSADVAGYSRLMGADDAGTFGEMRTRRELLRAQVGEGGGRVVDAVGDNLLAEFGSAVDAVQCAIDAQAAFAARDASLPESLRLPFRIGIHLGEVIVDGDAIAGDGVNVAARLCALAEPGGVTLSAAVAEQLRGKLELELEDRGDQQLKNIAAPVRVYRIRGVRAVGRAQPPAPSRESRPAIAVLPFENLGGDPEQEYLSDGIAEDLLTRMARWLLPVIARQSSFAYRGSRLDARQIGRELGARYLVEGSLRRSGSRIRLTVQLIDAETAEHVFAESFDRELGDVFALQDEIARAVARSLGASLSSRLESQALARAPESVDAWEALLRAQWHHNRQTPRHCEEARRFARLAIELDPRSAAAHAMLAAVESTSVAFGWSEDADESLGAGLRAARRAVELDPDDAGGHVALGSSHHGAGDMAAAKLAFERAVELAPEVAATHGNLGAFLVAAGEFDAAVTALERAIELSGTSPGSTRHPFWHLHLATAHFGAGRDVEALRWVERGLQLGDHMLLHGLGAAVLAHLGRLDEAERHAAHLGGFRVSQVERLFRRHDRGFADRLTRGLRLAGLPD
jgi:adenylate cyclase